jgi:DNA-binding transcriptional LysR family regulator
MPMNDASLDFASIGLLRSFVAVVESGGFSAAAKQLQLVPSTVSKHIGQLEAGLRVALIHRTTRNLEVTAAGRHFHARCLAILAEADQASLLGEAPTVLAGELRVLASPSFTSSVLLRALPAFTTQHPQLLVDLRVGAGAVDLIREGIDVSISLDETRRNKNPAVKLGDNACAVCAAPVYLEQHGVPQTPADLRRHHGLIGHGSPYAEEWPFLVGRSVKTYPVRKVFASDNGDVLRAYCLQGAGLGGFYRFHVAEDLRRGRLVEVLSNYRANASAVYALVQHRKYMNPPTQAFITFMRGVCAQLAAAG